jgi:membrane-associated protein
MFSLSESIAGALSWLKELHSAAGIASIVQAGGMIALTAIIFAETGLLVGFFLPGDSLLITAGVLANPANPNHVAALDVATMNAVLCLAAIIGDQTGYYLGHKAGDRIWERPDGRFYKRAHLQAAHEFYERYGGVSVVAARYVPIIRTFVPFVAGVARMPYRRFVFWNISGGLLWITSLLWLGYYLGATPLANRLDKLIVLVIFVSILPMIIGFARKAWSARRSAKGPSPATGVSGAGG